MRYDAIFLDADGTVLDFDSAERASVGVILDWLGIKDDKATEVYSALNIACWADYEKGRITQEDLLVRLFRELIEHYHANADPEEAVKRFVAKLATQGELLPGAEREVRRLAAVLPIAIVTNGISAVQRGRFFRSGIQDCVRELVISSETGYVKPDPRMFWDAARKLGVEPKRALMVGDSLSSDILGAQNAGVDACWFNPKGLPCALSRAPEYEIRSLSEITDRILI